MKHSKSILAICLGLALTGCDDGKDGVNGTNGTNGNDGTNGTDGITSLLVQNTLAAGNSHCFNGGVEIQSGLDTNGNGTLDGDEVTTTNYVCTPEIPSVIANLTDPAATFSVAVARNICNRSVSAGAAKPVIR